MAGIITNITSNCALAQTNITDNTYVVTGVPFNNLPAFTQTFTADTASHFKTPPSISLDNVSEPNNYTVTITDTFVDNVVTVRLFSIIYRADLKLPTEDELVFIAKAEPTFASSTNNIYGYEVSNALLDPQGESRVIKIHGDKGAQFKLQIWNKTPGYDNQDISGNPILTIPESGYYNYVLKLPSIKNWSPLGDMIYDQTIEYYILSHNSSVLKFDSTAKYLYQKNNKNLFLNIGGGSQNQLWKTDNTGLTFLSENYNLLTESSGNNAGIPSAPTNMLYSQVSGGYTGSINSLRLTSSGLTGAIPLADSFSLNFIAKGSGSLPSDVGYYEFQFYVKSNSSNNARIDFIMEDSVGVLAKKVVSTNQAWTLVSIQFYRRSTGALTKLRVGNVLTGNTGGFVNGQVVELAFGSNIKNTFLRRLDTNVSTTFNRAAGEEASEQHDFDFSVYLTNAGKKIKYYDPGNPAAGLRETYAHQVLTGNTDIPSTSGGASTTTILNPNPSSQADVVDNSDWAPSSIHWNSWRIEDVIPFIGQSNNEGNVLNYGFGSRAKVSGLLYSVVYPSSTASRAQLRIQGTLDIFKFPEDGNTSVELNLTSWFSNSTNSF